MKLDVLEHEIAVSGQLTPRSDSAVVVQRGDDDLVARREVTSGGPTEDEVQRRHVGSEGHLMRRASQEAGGLRFGLLEYLLDAEARLIAGAEVGAGIAERTGDCVPDLVWNLGSTRSIQEDEAGLQRTEPLTSSPQRVAACYDLGHQYNSLLAKMRMATTYHHLPFRSQE